MIGKITLGNVTVNLYCENDKYSFDVFILTNTGDPMEFDPKGFDGHTVPTSFKEKIKEHLQKIITESLKEPMRFHKVVR